MTTTQAGYIIRRKPQSDAEYAIVGEALTLLGKAGMSDEDVAVQAQRELTLAELIMLGQGRVSAGC